MSSPHKSATMTSTQEQVLDRDTSSLQTSRYEQNVNSKKCFDQEESDLSDEDTVLNGVKLSNCLGFRSISLSRGESRQLTEQTRTGIPQDSWITSLLDMRPRSPVAVQVALENTQTCSVMTKLNVEQLLLLGNNKVSMVEKKMQNEMAKLEKVKKFGLVHWCGVVEGRSTGWRKFEEERPVGGKADQGGRSGNIGFFTRSKMTGSTDLYESGSCPMCQVVMVMDLLRPHAAKCQGVVKENSPEKSSTASNTEQELLDNNTSFALTSYQEVDGDDTLCPTPGNETSSLINISTDKVFNRPNVSLSMQDMSSVPRILDLRDDEATDSNKKTDGGDDINAMFDDIFDGGAGGGGLNTPEKSTTIPNTVQDSFDTSSAQTCCQEVDCDDVNIDVDIHGHTASASPSTSMFDDRFEESLWDRCVLRIIGSEGTAVSMDETQTGTCPMCQMEMQMDMLMSHAVICKEVVTPVSGKHKRKWMLASGGKKDDLVESKKKNSSSRLVIPVPDFRQGMCRSSEGVEMMAKGE